MIASVFIERKGLLISVIGGEGAICKYMYHKLTF